MHASITGIQKSQDGLISAIILHTVQMIQKQMYNFLKIKC